jgi:hypothetical protein
VIGDDDGVPLVLIIVVAVTCLVFGSIFGSGFGFAWLMDFYVIKIPSRYPKPRPRYPTDTRARTHLPYHQQPSPTQPLTQHTTYQQPNNDIIINVPNIYNSVLKISSFAIIFSGR